MQNAKRICVAVASATALLFISTAASALPSVEIIWTSGGTVIASPAAGTTITADIVLRGDPGNPGASAAVTGVFVTIAFDNTELTALGGNELPTVNLPGMGNEFAPLTPGVNIFQSAGAIRNFDTSTLATGLANAQARTLGTVKFQVIAATGNAGENDVIANLSNAGIDAITGPGNANFVGADVTGPAPPVPEPTTAILLIAGLAGLGYAGRRNLR